MRSLELKFLINATPEAVWQALVDPKHIEEWGAGPALMNDKVGTEFSLWGGDIHGKNLEVLENDELVQEWYGGKWEKPSIVRFSLTEEDGKTRVTLTQTDIPESDFESISEGWKEYYFSPLRTYVEQKPASQTK